MKQKVVGWNYLYLHEAVILYSFYLLGVYLQRKKYFISEMAPKVLFSGIIVTLVLLVFMYDLNQGPFKFFGSVVVMLSSHGNFFLFPLRAVAGSVLILLLSQATPAWRAFTWMGQNALILVCLNGVFYHFVNPRVAQWFVEHTSGSAWDLLGAGVGVTILSLACCIPFIVVFNRIVPQLVGKPKVKGPLLWAFIKAAA